MKHSTLQSYSLCFLTFRGLHNTLLLSSGTSTIWLGDLFSMAVLLAHAADLQQATFIAALVIEDSVLVAL